jgi:tetratricopeptide (TPR) repeat protein
MIPSSRRARVLGVLLLLVLVGGGVAAYYFWFRKCLAPEPLPGPETRTYHDYLRAFQVGVAALDARQDGIAQAKLERAVALIPGEPAGWANLGLLNLRGNNFEQAQRDFDRARQLAPDSGAIAALLGQLAQAEGRLPEAVAFFREAAKKTPNDLPTLWALGQAVRLEGVPDSEAEYQRLMEQILKVQPNNFKALMERMGAAARHGDMAAVRDTLTRLDRLEPAWKPDTRKALKELHKAVAEAPEDVPLLVPPLDNQLKGERGYARSSFALVPPHALLGEPVEHFLLLQPPRHAPAPPDRDLGFAVEEWPATKVAGPAQRWDVLCPVWMIPEKQRAGLLEGRAMGGPHVSSKETFELAAFVANGREVRRADREAPALAFPGGKGKLAPSPAGVLALDWDNDFRQDLLLAGAGGLAFFKHQPDGTFKDVGKATGLAPAILGGDYFGAWAADVEMDGDLDVIAARRSGPPLLLRNNRDGTFTPPDPKERDPFPGVKDVRVFVWADLDKDGAPDAIFLDAAGKLHVFANERAGQFEPWPLPDNLGTFLAVTAADLNDDGVLDLVALRSDGMLVRISDKGQRKSWEVAELARGPSLTDAAPGTVALFVADLDNNGAADLVVAGPQETHVYLADEQGRLAPLKDAVPLRVQAVLDPDRAGRLDLLGLSAEGKPARARSRGGKNYHWQDVWPLANTKEIADDRINSFAIGGAVEVRSGTFVQTQPILSPVLHFGLGEQDEVDVTLVVWPNGSPQWEFPPEWPRIEQVIRAEQRLKGSCPFLFTWDGTAMHFAGDFMWGTPLGMRVNGQNIGDFPQTTEWLKIPGDKLVPHDGYYDVRVHANLWETDYFDQLALRVVDHPPGTEIYADERFFLTPTAPKLYVTTPARPVARAWDHKGEDATELVRYIDGRYLDRAGRGRFQGVTRDHWVEADLGDDAPTEGPVYLVARGWVHPTDSSINVALEQGRHERPHGLVLEVPDGKGGWKVGRPALGFPAGRNKTILIRLDGIEGKGVSRRFRLRTNMEIFWDFLGYARGLDGSLAKVQRLSPLVAELRYRGLLETTQRDSSSPEIPHYDKVMRGVQRWRDLTGYYTRFGDVKELLAAVDDRYVIMNAGDEIALRFPVPAGPPPGWHRDFLWESDGWTKDGDPNTRFGTTVLPLPAHKLKASDRPPGDLQDDPVYRMFPQDWVNYHTRYVTPAEFDRGLRNFSRPSSKR